MGSGRVFQQHWFRGMLLAVFAGAAMVPALPAQETPPMPAEAPKVPAVAEPSEITASFQLIETYNEKIRALQEFRNNQGLEQTDLQQRKSRAADEVDRLIGGLESLMEQEAEKIYEVAMKADPKERDRLLTRLVERFEELNYIQLEEIRRRVENDLNRRTVGEKLYPTIEEARAAQRKLEEANRKKNEERDAEQLKALDDLKQDLLTDRILESARRFAEEDAWKMLESAMRLVLPQRRVQLNEIIRKYPNTKAAAEATAVLSAMDEQNNAIANRKLEHALHSPAIYDQRWRRLKEIERDHPKTPAADQAKQIFDQHLAQVPPVSITNLTNAKAELTVDRPYSKADEVTLGLGETRTFTSAFPQMIRLLVRENEWDVYRVWPGTRFSIEAPEGIPVLRPLP